MSIKMISQGLQMPDYSAPNISTLSAQIAKNSESFMDSTALFPEHIPAKSVSNYLLPTNVTRSNLTSMYPHLNQNNLFQELPPIANAGPAQVVTSGSSVILNGSNSKSEYGKIVSYSWEQLPTNAKTTLSGVDTPVWVFVAPPVVADTILRFQLTVTDSAGQSGHDTVNILDKPNLGTHLQTNIARETIIPGSKNSSMSTGIEKNTVVIPSNASKFSSRTAITSSILPPPLTPPRSSTRQH
jgi:hypothetical protein